MRIVLIETSYPGNIGSVARAMKTMGFTELYLVNPKRYPALEATKLASGATDVLANAKIVTTLDEAIRDCHLILGTSARDRSLPWPMVTPNQIAKKITSEESIGKIAILFGRENRGLSNEEMQRCHYHIQIPANPAYSSLNLAQAVQIICYEIRLHLIEKVKEEAGYDGELADSYTLELLYTHLETVLYEIEFLKPNQPNRIMPRLRRLFYRARPDITEVSILRGILTEIQRKTRKLRIDGQRGINPR